MKKFRIELAGTITRDIIWLNIDAETKDEAYKLVSASYPSHKISFIEEYQDRPHSSVDRASAF